MQNQSIENFILKEYYKNNIGVIKEKILEENQSDYNSKKSLERLRSKNPSVQSTKNKRKSSFQMNTN